MAKNKPIRKFASTCKASIIFLQIRKYLSDVIGDLPMSPQQHRVALATFSDNVHFEFLMGQRDADTSPEVVSHILGSAMQYPRGGNTNTSTAITWARAYLNGARYRKHPCECEHNCTKIDLFCWGAH